MLVVGAVSDARAWATITVNSLADPGKPGICALRDAITAANTMIATNGCIAGKGHDTIQFSITGTITLTETLPEITDSNLTINGPASPGITISGGGKVQVMQATSGATLSLINLTISDGLGESEFDAGGIVNEGTLTVTNCKFLGNSGGNFVTFGGAGAILNQAALRINNSSFSDNNAGADFGVVGGILNQGTLSVTNSTFSGNKTSFNGAATGAIDNSGTLTVIGSTFSDNFGGGDGAIGNGGTATIYNSTFSRNAGGANEGSGFAGGIGNGNQAEVIDSTFSGNTAAGVSGGGVLNGIGGTLKVTNSTFENPNDIGNFGEARLKGTIVAGNCTIFPGNGFISNTLPITDLGYNISSDDSCGFTATGSLNNTDPMLDPAGLSSNGGLTQTIALLMGSPAIDAIPLASCVDQAANPLATDQRGFPRPDAEENLCDIGAYEFQDFAGQPGTRSCRGVSVSVLTHQFRNIKAAASALRFPSVKALQAAITVFCRA
jgi:hypothetical protein